MKRIYKPLITLIAALILMPSISLADGMIFSPTPRPDQPPIMSNDLYSVKYHKVYVEINDQIATTTVEQAFVNETGRAIEVVYVFPLPKGAQVQKFSLFVGDRELQGKLLTSEEARREYENIVRQMRDPALLEYLGNGMFKSSVFPLPPHGETKLRLVYQELLKKEEDRVEYLYPLNTEKFSKKNLEEVEINFNLKTTTNIKNVYSPGQNITPQWDGDKHVSGKWSEKNVKPDQDFRLFWNLSKAEVGATLFTYRPDAGEDGYFIFLATPEVGNEKRKVINKDIILVLDKSGSMSGDKIKQARNAAEFIVRNLEEGDKFNVIFYDDAIDPLWNDLRDYTAATRDEAVKKIRATQADGSTNIHGALTTAMGMVPASTRPHYIIFMTDGLPTAGPTTDPAEINKAVQLANKQKARLFSFGVGWDVNSILLDRLGVSNHGLSEYVKPDEDIEAKVSRFYAKIQSPALTDISLNYGNIRIRDTYPRELPDLFRGEQLVIVGRYRDAGAATIVLNGSALDKKSTFQYNFTFAQKTDDEQYSFVARLWAQKKIGYLIEQIRLNGEKKELIDEIVKLSTRYGILTEYTSFLALEDTDLHAPGNVARTEENIKKRANVASGAGGVSQSMQSKAYQNTNQAPNKAAYFDEEGSEITVSTIRVIGSKTFYLKKGVWTDSEYKEGMKLTEVNQLSTEYFDLANKAPVQAKYMTFTHSDTIIVVIEGKAYKFTPLKK